MSLDDPDLFALYWGPRDEPQLTEAEEALERARTQEQGVRAAEHRDLTKVARHGSLQLAGAASNSVLSLVLIVLAAHILGPGGTGAFYVGIALFMIVSNLAELGADTGLMRMIPHYRALNRSQDLRNLLIISLVPVFAIGLVLAIPLIVFAPDLARIVSNHHDPAAVLPYIRIFALFLPLSGLSTVALAGARGFGAFLPSVAVENVGKPAVRPFLLFAVVSLGLGTTAVALSWSAPIAVGAAISVGWLLYLLRRTERIDRRQGRGSGPQTPRSTLAIEFWRFAAPRSLMAFFTVIVTWLDTLLLASMRSTGEAGIYTAATRLTFPGNMALGAIILVISPQIARYLARPETRRRAEQVYQTATWWLVAATWPAFIATAIFAPLLLSIFGHRFQAGVTVTVIMSIASLINMATGPVGAVLLMGGYSVVGLLVSLTALVLNVVLNLILIPRYGMTGSAIAWGTSIVFNNIAALAAAWRLLGIGPVGRGFILIAISSVATFGGLGLLTRAAFGTGVLAFIGYLIVACALYGAILYRLRGTLQLAALMDGFRSRNTLPPPQHRQGPVRRSV